jgi:hypothetical protein
LLGFAAEDRLKYWAHEKHAATSTGIFHRSRGAPTMLLQFERNSRFAALRKLFLLFSVRSNI